MFGRLAAYWVYGGALAGLLGIGLLWLAAPQMSAALAAVALLLPLYMLHQFEEHDDDRFRRFFNTLIGGGREVLTLPAVFIINIGGVWIVYFIAIALAARVDLGLGLIAVYGTLVNALVHLAAAAAKRRYNPGLATAVIFFLPAGITALWLVHGTGEAGLAEHAIGLAVAIGIHAVIVAYALRRRQSLGG
ncbi:MAG: HXXEE domain-containing protein [Bosea sp.]|nr:HXXEE domain-containing protein [Bosea sp. (in: a-proteobacteria)]